MSLILSGSLWLNLAISVGLPMLVALVTKQTAHPGLKAILLLALSAVSGFLMLLLQAVSAHSAFDFTGAMMQTILGFGMAVLAHYGLLRPIGVTGAPGVIQTRLPHGLG